MAEEKDPIDLALNLYANMKEQFDAVLAKQKEVQALCDLKLERMLADQLEATRLKTVLKQLDAEIATLRVTLEENHIIPKPHAH